MDNLTQSVLANKQNTLKNLLGGNQDSKIFNRISSTELMIRAPSEEEVSELGFQDDFELIKVLEQAILHPKIEII